MMTDAERVLSRARSLMQTRGYGWSKALAAAMETTHNADSNPATDGRRTTGDGSGVPAVVVPGVSLGSLDRL
jgi:hypothetical protein